MKLLFPFLILLSFFAKNTVTAQSLEDKPFKVAVTTLSVPDTVRPLKGHIWYPSSDTEKEKLIGGNPVWEGYYAIQNAEPATGQFPLIVISHGSFGNSQNQAWLATIIARSGYIVATPNHPGTSTFLQDPEARRKLWERPKDISRTISSLLKSSKFGNNIDKRKIIVIGHSLGGFDAMELAGARYNKEKYDKFCRDHTDSIDCKLLTQWGVAADKESQKQMEASLVDKRITAAIIFDLGGTQSFSKASLANIKLPILVLAAGHNLADMNIDHESRALVDSLPSKSVEYFEMENLSHFDFLGVCKSGATSILKDENPKDAIICIDGGEKRKVQQALVTKHVFNFLKSIIH